MEGVRDGTLDVIATDHSPFTEFEKHRDFASAPFGITGLETLVNTLYPGVHALGAPRRLPLLEMCLPALKAMSPDQYRLFKRTLVRLIQFDEQTHVYEWCIFQIVKHYLDPEFGRVKPSRPRYRALQQVSSQVQTVLSLLALDGSGPAQEAFRLGADELNFRDMHLLDREQCPIAAFSRAVYTLADCFPLLKPRLLKAMMLAAGGDGTLSPVEREIIASMAAVMDCPLPIAAAA